jgi:zinc protease
MFRPAFRAAFGLAACLCMFPGTSVPCFSAEAADLVRLANGFSVLVVRDDRFPLVSARLYAHAGAAFESAEEAGISHLLEHMVFKGTNVRPAGRAARDVEAAGGYLNAYTSFDNTVYLVDMPSARWELALDILRDMAFNASLRPEDLEPEKEVIVSELQRGKDNPSSLVFELLQAEALKNTPYERPIIGFEDSIRSFTADRMRDYIARWYQPQSMLLVVVGNVEVSRVQAEAERLFGGLRNSSPVHPPKPVAFEEAAGRGPSVVVRPGPWNKVYLGLAFPAPAERDPRSLSLDVLARLLAGDPSSYLPRRYKYEKRLVHGISAHNMSFERLGLFCLNVELDADKLESFWKEFCADLASLDASRFSERELRAARLNLEDGIHRSKESLGGTASWKGHLQFFLGGQEAEADMLALLRRADFAQVNDAVRAFLRPDRAAVAALTPQGAALPDLEAAFKRAWPLPKEESAAKKAGRGDVEDVDLGRGRRLILLPDASLPYFSLDFVQAGGDLFVTEDTQGLADLAARVLTTGTKKRGGMETERFLADRAASLAASADRQSFSLSLRGPSRFSDELFSLLRETLRNPAFSPKETERGKTAQIAAIRSSEDKPLGLLFRRLPPFLFPGHPYGRLRLGGEKRVRAFTSGDLRAFWNRQKAQPWVMAVAGDFDREKVLNFARSLPAAGAARPDLEPPSRSGGRTLELKLPQRQQAHLLLIFKAVPSGHPDNPGMELLENILSGQSGPLFTELRDRRALAYTVAAFNRPMPEAGYMAFYIGTAPQKLQQAREGFEQVLQKLHDELLPAEETERGVNRMEGDYYRGRQSLASRSGEAAALASLGRPLSFNRETIDKARLLSPEDLRSLIRRYLRIEDAYTAQVLP